MTRDRIFVGAALVAVVALAVYKAVITAQTVLLIGVAIPSIILHEVSHGVVALWFGDDTAKRAGRLTLNPVPHVDVVGTLLLPALLALGHAGVFGYAKPVPIDPNRMRHPRNGALIVSLAGPATNVVLAVVAALWLRQRNPLQYVSYDAGPWLARIPLALGVVNVTLAVFNLLPIPPLDGSSVVTRLLPKEHLAGWYRFRPYGMVVLLLLILLPTSPLGRVITPAQNLWLRLASR